MRLSTKGRFAVTAMIDIALREQFGPVPLAEIASRQQISLSYLEQLFSKLRLQGLVASIRGPGGGYTVGRRTNEITVADIISAVEDASSKEKQPSASVAQETAQDLWAAMDLNVLNFTQAVTLKSLILDQLAQGTKVDHKPPSNRGVFKKPVHYTIRPNVPNSVFALGRALQIS